MPGLILPRSVVEEPRYVLRCECCGAKFEMDHTERFTRHVKKCSEINAEAIERKVAEIKNNYFTAPADPEMFEHFRRGGT